MNSELASWTRGHPIHNREFYNELAVGHECSSKHCVHFNLHMYILVGRPCYLAHLRKAQTNRLRWNVNAAAVLGMAYENSLTRWFMLNTQQWKTIRWFTVYVLRSRSVHAYEPIPRSRKRIKLFTSTPK